MNFKYGISGHERNVGTVIEFNNGFGFLRSFNYKDRILIRDEEYMRPVGPYYLPIDGISSNLQMGDVIEYLAIETTDGLMALRSRKIGTIHEEVTYNGIEKEFWGTMNFPRLIGCVQEYRPERAFGFIKSDEVTSNSFFHKCELLVPYENSGDPRAVDRVIERGVLVTFDSAETPNGMRAFAVRRLKREN